MNIKTILSTIVLGSTVALAGCAPTYVSVKDNKTEPSKEVIASCDTQASQQYPSKLEVKDNSLAVALWAISEANKPAPSMDCNTTHTFAGTPIQQSNTNCRMNTPSSLPQPPATIIVDVNTDLRSDAVHTCMVSKGFKLSN